jgi:hypothetical protein
MRRATEAKLWSPFRGRGDDKAWPKHRGAPVVRRPIEAEAEPGAISEKGRGLRMSPAM